MQFVTVCHQNWNRAFLQTKVLQQNLNEDLYRKHFFFLL